MAVSAAGAMSLKRSFSSLDLAADARAARARRSALRRRAQPSNKEGPQKSNKEDPTLETLLKDTTTTKTTDMTRPRVFDLTTTQEAQNATTMKAEAEVSPEGLATLAQLLADETTADKTTTADDGGDSSGTLTGPMTNSWGPVIIEGWPGVPETTEEDIVFTNDGSPTTDSDLAFGADPVSDRAASEDLAQLESQPDSKGEPFYSDLYPHCGCDPAKGCFSPLGASWCRVASSWNSF